MIQFKISAPNKLSLFGEHAVNYGKKGLTAGINLRTTLTFTELSRSPSDSILQLDCPQIYLFLNVPLQIFLRFYSNCIENMNLLREKVLQFTNYSYSPDYRRIIVETFYYLLVYIIYKEQIDIKSFNIYLFTNLMIDNEFICPASFVVCLAACLLHWSRLQKGAHDTFDPIDLEKIYLYAACCEKIFPESEIIDVTACTYGSMIQHQIGKPIRFIPFSEMQNVTILLVDSKKPQNLQARTQRLEKLIYRYSKDVNKILNDIDIATDMAINAIQKLDFISTNNKFDLATKRLNLMYQHDILITSICINQESLQMLKISTYDLNKICSIAKCYKFSGKYTNIGKYGRYAYIWCAPRSDVPSTHIMDLSNELKMHDFNVTITTLDCSEVRIELMTD